MLEVVEHGKCIFSRVSNVSLRLDVKDQILKETLYHWYVPSRKPYEAMLRLA